jgi:hypothetical protein
MFQYIYHLSDIKLFITIISALALLSLIGIVIVRKCLPEKVLFKDNDVFGFVSGLIGIIYGVLTGLMALYLLNNTTTANTAVLNESNALADIYRESKWLTPPTRAMIQTQIRAYIKHAIEVEWPAMDRGESVDNQGIEYIENITDVLIHYNLGNAGAGESLLVHDMLDEVRNLYDSRQQRIEMSYAQLSPEIWIVVLIGTVLLIVTNYFYGMNFYLHLLLIFAIALMASAMVFLLVTLDRPFQGEFVVDPDELTSLRDFIENQTSAPPRTQVAPKLKHANIL